MRHPASVPLLFVLGFFAALVGDWIVRLDPSLHHAGVAHAAHTVLLAVPAGLMGGLLLREERIVAAALLAVAGWAAGIALVALLLA